MSTIRKLISPWMLALVGSLLLPLVSVAAVSGTTYDTSSTTTSISSTIAQHTAAVTVADYGGPSLQSMADGLSRALFGRSHFPNAPNPTVRVQHATGDAAAESIMKQQKLTSSSDFVYGVEAKVPGQVASTSDELLGLGAKQADKVIEFDVPVSELLKNEVGDVILPSPVNLGGRNPTVLPVKKP